MRPDVEPSKEAVRVLRQEGVTTLLSRASAFLIKELLLVYYRFVDSVEGRLLTTPFTLKYTGKYRVDPKVDSFPEFDFWYRFDSPHVRHRILGEYETEVGEKISQVYDSETNFWEVGVGWGYHSLSIADTVNRVVGFDPDTRRTDLLRKSCEANDTENISVVNDEVDSLDEYVDDFGHPDIVLVDIDGWEYDVLPNSTGLLDHGCCWIVELHHDVDAPPAQDSDPEDIERMFEERGYSVETIREHYQRRSWRGGTTDSLNTHHIFARPERQNNG